MDRVHRCFKTTIHGYELAILYKVLGVLPTKKKMDDEWEAQNILISSIS